MGEQFEGDHNKNLNVASLNGLFDIGLGLIELKGLLGLGRGMHRHNCKAKYFCCLIRKTQNHKSQIKAMTSSGCGDYYSCKGGSEEEKYKE